MSKPLEGRRAVVTGGARGLGQAYAKMLASRGAHVAVADMLDSSETTELIHAEGREAYGAQVDVSDPDAVAAFGVEVEARFGPVDILVSNAGVGEFGRFEEISWESWRRVIGINLDAGFLCAKAFVPGMRRRQWGRLIFISSNTAWTNSPMFAHYVTSKMGVVGLARALASELGEDGITANAIAPSIVRTPMTEGTPAKGLFDQYKTMQAIHRQEEPEDLAMVVAFLASEDSRFITGQTIAVDGGVIRL